MNKIRLLALLGVLLSFNTYADYPDTKVYNKTGKTITSGKVYYASAFCGDDKFGKIKPGKSSKAKSRGVCLITKITAKVSGEKVKSYTSSGTSYSKFHLVNRNGNYRIYSDKELKSGKLDYPYVNLKNNSDYTAKGTVEYASAFCANDDYSVKPGDTWKATSRGVCLVTGITAKLQGKSLHGESTKVVRYDSSGTSYSKFQISAYGGSYKVFSNSEYKEATDVKQSKSPGFFLVNKTPWAVSYLFSQGVGCTNHGIVPASSNGEYGIYKVSKVGAVWFKMSLQVQPDGIDPTDSFVDCALPVAELVGDVAMTVFTGGSGAAITTALKTSAKLAAKEVAKRAGKAAGKAIIKKMISDFTKQELGKLFSLGTLVELEGQYAGYEWPARCEKMPEYHITGGPLIFEEDGKRYLSRGKPFMVKKINTCGDDMMLASPKKDIADQGVFSSLELGGIKATDVSEVVTGKSQKGGIELAFTHQQSYSITGYNNKRIKNKTRKQCMAACANETAFICKSFDYHNNLKTCDLSEASGKQKKNTGKYDYYEFKFNRVKNTAIKGFNNKTLGPTSRSECVEECANTPWCKSVEYKKENRLCNLSDHAGPPLASKEFDLFILK